MKITCSKKDDIIRDRDRYDSAKSAHDDMSKKVRRRYYDDVKAITQGVAAIIQDKLAGFDKLQFEVNVDSGWSDDMEATIRCNEHNKFADDVALAWNWETTLTKDGEVKSKTGSWSGLSATTPEQIESLEQSVSAIKVLNNIDWKKLLTVELPKFEEYIKDIPKFGLGERPDFEKQLAEAELEELIGANKLVELTNGKYYYHSYAGILSESPAMYTIFEVSASKVSAINDGGEVEIWNPNIKQYDQISDLASLAEAEKVNSYKVKKDNFMRSIKKPMNIIEY